MLQWGVLVGTSAKNGNLDLIKAKNSDKKTNDVCSEKTCASSMNNSLPDTTRTPLQSTTLENADTRLLTLSLPDFNSFDSLCRTAKNTCTEEDFIALMHMKFGGVRQAYTEGAPFGASRAMLLEKLLS